MAAISRGPSLRCLGAGVLLAALVSLPLPAQGMAADRAHPLRVPPAFYGMHDGSIQSYAHLHVGSVRLWDAGVTWQNLETAPGVFTWTRLDALVSAARQQGAEVTLVLGMTPSFYGSAVTLPPSDLSRFAAYVTAVMRRYRSFDGTRGISAYQVWNEGNISSFWTGTPHQLARLTAIVARVREQVDPRATVVAPSFAVRLPYQLRWMKDYEAQKIGGRPVWRYVDANGPSLYPRAAYGRRIGGPEDAMRILARVRRLLAGAGVPRSMPLWASEVNYGVVGGPDGPAAATPITERRQVANVMRTYLLGAARGLARVFWYRYDWNVLPSVGGTLGNTLLTVPSHPDQVTAAGRAFDTVQGWLRGRLVGVHGLRPCAPSPRGTYTCVVRSTTGTRTIMWNPTHRVRIGVRGAAFWENAAGVRSRVSHRSAPVRVGFAPVMVAWPRPTSG